MQRRRRGSLREFVRTGGWGVIGLMAAVLGADAAFAAPDCAEEYSRVATYYSEHYLQSRIHFQYRISGMTGGKERPAAIANLWQDGDRMRFEDGVVSVYQDSTTQTVIMWDRRFILLRPSPRLAGGPTSQDAFRAQLAPTAVQLDSLQRVVEAIRCDYAGDVATLRLDFPRLIEGRANPVKSITLSYVAATGEMKRGDYEYYSDRGVTRDTFEYLAVTESVPDSVWSSPLVSSVLSGASPCCGYDDFEVKDLRGIGTGEQRNKAGD